MAKHLEDIGKDAKDLLTESFPIDGTVKVTGQGQVFGLVQKLTISRTLKREKGSVREIVSAAFEPKYDWKDQNLEFTGKFTSGHDVTVGSSVRDLLGQGSKIELNASLLGRDGMNGGVIASYKNDILALKAKAIYPLTPKKPLKVSAETVLHHSGSNSNVGLGVDVCLEGDTVKIFGESVLSHTAPDAQYKAHLRYDVYDSSLNGGLSFWQRFSEKSSWAFDILSEEWATRTTFTAGSEYKCSDACSFKGKWKVTKNSDKTDYRFGASLKYKVSPHVIATIGSDLNPRSFLGSLDGEPHSFGLELKLQE